MHSSSLVSSWQGAQLAVGAAGSLHGWCSWQFAHVVVVAGHGQHQQQPAAGSGQVVMPAPQFYSAGSVRYSSLGTQTLLQYVETSIAAEGMAAGDDA